jgi:hypothetical protein
MHNQLGRLSLAALVAVSTLATGAGLVAAADPGPIQVPFSVLHDPGPTSCPGGLEVALPADPASGGLPGVAVFVGPGPIQCAPGVTVFKDAGPIQTPGTVAQLPLNAADCAVGAASLQATADALGLVVALPDPAQPPGPSQCPAGDALTAALARVIGAQPPGPTQCPNGVAVAVGPGPIQRLSPGLLVLGDPGPTQCPSGTALLLVPARSGIVRGVMVLGDPGPINRAYVIVPGGSAGCGLISPGPIQ